MLWLQLAIILVLIVLNGFFALAEMAVISARTARLQHGADLGQGGARIALELKRDPGRFLSTVQIGITVIGVLASAFGGATLADTLASALRGVPGWQAYANSIAFAVVVIGISYLTLILGELVPKRIALGRPETIARHLSGFLRALARVLGPIEWLLSASSNLVLRLLPVHGESRAATEEEIGLMVREAAAAGHFDATESNIVQMALRIGDRRVGGMMTPRTLVEWLDLTDDDEENRRKIRDSDFSRFPVVEGDSHIVAGIVQLKDLLSAMLAGKPFDLRGTLRPAFFVPDTVTALRALELFKQRGEAMALVVDEYGAFEGVLTLHDILQSLVGDIAEPGDESHPAVVQREDGSWLVDGMTPVDEVRDLTGLASLPGAESGDFHTLGGFMMAGINRIPSVGDHVAVEGFGFEVVNMDGRRVDRVLITPPTEKKRNT
jgi:putative hemolysin